MTYACTCAWGVNMHEYMFRYSSNLGEKVVWIHKTENSYVDTNLRIDM